MDSQEYEDPKAQAAQMAKGFHQTETLLEAELAAAGIHPVTVVHGYAETDSDAHLIFEVLPARARDCGRLAMRGGGSDYTTYWFSGPEAERAATRFIAEALKVANSWWRITPTSRPQR